MFLVVKFDSMGMVIYKFFRGIFRKWVNLVFWFFNWESEMGWFVLVRGIFFCCLILRYRECLGLMFFLIFVFIVWILVILLINLMWWFLLGKF